MSPRSTQPPGGHDIGPVSRGRPRPTTREEQVVRDADWLESTDDDPDGDAPRRARPLLLALASVPWLVVIALLVLPGRMGSEDRAPGAADSPSSAEPDQGDARPGADAGIPGDAPPGGTEGDGEGVDGGTGEADGGTPGGGPNPTVGTGTAGLPDEIVALQGREVRGGWRVAAGPEEAVALAVVAGRAWLTGVEPILELGFEPGPRSDGGYAEHLVVEAVEQPAADAIVVTLVAVVLDVGGGSPEVRRMAVPVAVTPDGPRLAGSPWDLPPPVLDQVTLPRETTTDPTDLEAARTALVSAGLTDLDLVALNRTEGWPVIAEVATAGTDVTHEVWLRRHLEGFAVAGTTLAGASASTEPASASTSEQRAVPDAPNGPPNDLPDPDPDPDPDPETRP